METGVYNFTIRQGATFSRVFTITGLDLSVYDGVRMQIRSSTSSKTVIWDSKNGGLTLDTDKIILNLTASETEKMDFSKAGYDMELFKNDTPEIVDKVLTGEIDLVREFTKTEV